jgi:hypothetical protein
MRQPSWRKGWGGLVGSSASQNVVPGWIAGGPRGKPHSLCLFIHEHRWDALHGLHD